MNEFKFIAEEKTFVVEVEGKKLCVSFEEKHLPWREAQQWCKENGGGGESVANIRLLSKYREQINKELEALGKEILGGWYWSNEPSYISPDLTAFGVSLSNGLVSSNYQGIYDSVRAVSAL